MPLDHPHPHRHSSQLAYLALSGYPSFTSFWRPWPPAADGLPCSGARLPCLERYRLLRFEALDLHPPRSSPSRQPLLYLLGFTTTASLVNVLTTPFPHPCLSSFTHCTSPLLLPLCLDNFRIYIHDQFPRRCRTSSCHLGAQAHES